MTPHLCHASHCRRDPETDQPAPRETAPGLNLCPICRRRLAEDALYAAVRYQDCGLALTATGQPGGAVVSGTTDHGLALNAAAVEARSLIRHTLCAMTSRICDERGFTLPADDVPTLARYVARNAEWAAARDDAGDWSAELRELAWGRPRRVAYPGRSRRFAIKLPGGRYAPCVETVEVDDTADREACPGRLWTILSADAPTPSEIVCDFDEQHRWPASRWLRLGAAMRTVD